MEKNILKACGGEELLEGYVIMGGIGVHSKKNIMVEGLLMQNMFGEIIIKQLPGTGSLDTASTEFSILLLKDGAGALGGERGRDGAVGGNDAERAMVRKF